jgi:hypothetical protein
MNPAPSASAGTGETQGWASKIVSPTWGSTVPERVAWAVWFVGTQPQVYTEFKRFADDFYRAGRSISAEMCLNLVRWQSMQHTRGDVFAVNSNARSLLGRLYLLERPAAKIEKRKSWVDLLHPNEMQEIVTVWREAHASQVAP